MYPSVDTGNDMVRTYTSSLTETKALGFLEQIFFMLAFMSFFIPAGYAVSHTVLLVWRATAAFMSAVAVLLYLTLHKITLRWSLLCFGVFIYFVGAKLAVGSDGSMILAVFNFIETCGLITLFEYGCAMNKREFIRLFLIAGVIMCSVHYATFLIYRDIPRGMLNENPTAAAEGVEQGTWFFFKHDNGSAFFFLPVMALLWYYLAEYNKGKFVTFVFTALSLYMYWSQWSVAAMLVFTAAVVCYVVIMLFDGKTPLSYFGYRLAVVAGLICCMFFVLVSTGSIATWLGEVFHKRSDFGGRGRIWDKTLAAIRSQPLFGYGFENDITTRMRISANHCHNVVMQTQYTGGLIDSIVMLTGFLSCSRERIFDYTARSKGASILNISIFLLLVLAGIDWYYFIAIPFTIFIASAYTDK